MTRRCDGSDFRPADVSGIAVRDIVW